MQDKYCFCLEGLSCASCLCSMPLFTALKTSRTLQEVAEGGMAGLGLE